MSTIRRKFEQARDRAAALAAQAERSDAEDIELADQLDRAEEYKTELDAVDERNARIAALAPVSRALAIPGTLDRSVALEAPEMSAGEYLAEYFKAYHPNGGSTPTEFIDRAGEERLLLRLLDVVQPIARVDKRLPRVVAKNVVVKIRFGSIRRALIKCSIFPVRLD